MLLHRKIIYFYRWSDPESRKDHLYRVSNLSRLGFVISWRVTRLCDMSHPKSHIPRTTSMSITALKSCLYSPVWVPQRWGRLYVISGCVVAYAITQPTAERPTYIYLFIS